jgi:hypothetical protein
MFDQGHDSISAASQAARQNSITSPAHFYYTGCCINIMVETRASRRLSAAGRELVAAAPPAEDVAGAEKKEPRRSRRLIERPGGRDQPGSSSDAAAPTTEPARQTAGAVAPLRRAPAGRRVSGRPPKRTRCDPQLTGLWEKLPAELLDMILGFCGPRQLGRLETTCNYFRSVKKLDAMCYERLKSIPRAKGMEPNRGCVPG